MKTLRERSRSTHHNHGERPLYFRPRFFADPNRRRRSSDWSGATRLALFGVVVLILGAYAAYRALSEPPSVPEPTGPRVEFHQTQPIHERLDPQNSA